MVPNPAPGMSANNGNSSSAGGWEWGASYPKNIDTEVDVSGLIPVQTSDGAGVGSGNEQGARQGAGSHAQQQQQQQQPNADIAGVLKRNQACLQCRRRKLVSAQPFTRRARAYWHGSPPRDWAHTQSRPSRRESSN